MKRLYMFWALGFAICLSILYLNSCNDDRKYPVEPVEAEPEFQLIYGPAGGLDFYQAIYSTKTGEMVDSVPLYDTLYSDVCFTADGRYAIYSGWSQDNPRDGLLWIEDYNSKETINIVKTKRSRKIHIDQSNCHVLIPASKVLFIYSFPGLDLIYIDSADFLTGGLMTSGFLPGEGRIFYLLEDNDSLFALNFENPDSTKLVSYYIEELGRSLKPSMGASDYQNNNLVLISRDEFSRTLIQVYEADGFQKKQYLRTSRFYTDISIQPNSTRVFLYNNNADFIYHSFFDLYDIHTNTIQTYIDEGDIIVMPPFLPNQAVFTPDGNNLYILIGLGTYGSSAVLGIDAQSKSVIQYFRPEGPYGHSIAINPINHSY